jgi:response regulator RpfG family c-di-GMP phosphodiesterase
MRRNILLRPTIVPAVGAGLGGAPPERATTGDRLRERRLLLTMAELSEAKAGYSSGHAARVSALAVILARELGLSPGEVTIVENAAIMHDVGELVVDPLILALSRKLDPQEEDAVRATGRLAAQRPAAIKARACRGAACAGRLTRLRPMTPVSA